MIGTIVTFQYEGDLDAAKVENIASDVRAMFEGMPGLRSKTFTFDKERKRATNFYVWESDEQARAFFTDALRDRVTGLYGVAPTIEFVEIAELVDNANR